MVDKALFPTYSGAFVPPTDTVNNAGGTAYKMSPKAALAQYAMTGCLGNTFYVSAQMQLDMVINLCKGVDEAFVAKCAIYTRQLGFMKDMPALLVAYLGVTKSKHFGFAFDAVIDNGKMLRNFVQIVRSGVLGRKSFGSTMKAKICHWLNTASDRKLIKASVGQKPSLFDIVRMVHPKALDDNRNELYKWILGKEFNVDKLPIEVVKFECYKLCPSLDLLPDVPFQMLTALPLGDVGWKNIAVNAPWHMCRMNLNTFKRHGVLEDATMVDMIACKLKDTTAISNARVYPYQLMTAYLNVEPDMPYAIKEALQDALEIATQNVPSIDGNLVIGIDISGSMASPVTGHRGSVTSKARYVDVAALFGASLLRKNPQAKILPFHGNVAPIDFNPRDTVMTNARKLSDACTNGTNLSSVFTHVLQNKLPVDLMVIVSDSESWMDSERASYFSDGTQAMKLWNNIKQQNPQAKVICINISPNATTQVKERDDIINIAGFSDTIFDLIAVIAKSKSSMDYFVNTIDNYVNIE